jgi:glycosyltransferase involved in cell wall biosynthesis
VTIRQNYPEFEIVLIDDASSDSTLRYIWEYENYPIKIKLKSKKIVKHFGNQVCINT